MSLFIDKYYKNQTVVVIHLALHEIKYREARIQIEVIEF